MKIGLFFGTFNPIHVGHLIIANYMAENTDLEKVWFVISPHNPLKDKNSLLNEKNRLYMVNIALEDNPNLVASRIEFHLSQPSYTINTLIHLEEEYPQHHFVLILGSDNLETFPKWKNYEKILENSTLYIYRREGYDAVEFSDHPKVKFFDVPLLNISASNIRNNIKEGRSVKYMIPDKPLQYILDMHFYEK